MSVCMRSADGVVDEPVPLQRRQAGEPVGHDPHPEMSSAVTGAGVALVQMAFVEDFDLARATAHRSVARRMRATRAAVTAGPGGRA